MLKNLIPKLGRGPKFIWRHGNCLDKEHFKDVVVVGVNFAAARNMFVLHCVQHGQDVCVVAPHALEHLAHLGGSHVPRSITTAQNSRLLSADPEQGAGNDINAAEEFLPGVSKLESATHLPYFCQESKVATVPCSSQARCNISMQWGNMALVYFQGPVLPVQWPGQL